MSRRTLSWLVFTLVGAAAMGLAFWRPSPMVFGACALIAVFGLGARDLIECGYRRTGRQQEMRQAAERLGFEFRVKTVLNVLGWSEAFELTREGMRSHDALSKSALLRKISEMVTQSHNVLLRGADDRRVAVFDYLCPSCRDREVSVVQTVFAARGPGWNHPYFALLPATRGNWLTQKFRSTGELRDGYRVETEDRDVVAPLVDRCLPLLDGTICLEAGEGYVLLYRREKVVDGSAIDEFIQFGLEATLALEQAAAEHSLAAPGPLVSVEEGAAKWNASAERHRATRESPAGSVTPPKRGIPDVPHEEADSGSIGKFFENLSPEQMGAFLMGGGVVVTVLLVCGYSAVAVGLTVAAAVALCITTLRAGENAAI